MRNRALRGLVAFALGVGLLTGPAAVTASAKECAASQEIGETLYLDLDTGRHRYRLGEIVYVTARVSRTSFDSGLPMVPVRDAGIFVYLNVGDNYLYGAGTTDVRGAVSIPIRIRRKFSPGMADATGFAHLPAHEGHCIAVSESGDVAIPSFLRILG
ncbi:MAG: hypothetical protein M3285_13150 [Actinomycetota bacterium]|nr:hypothetical protein [Actinomycetota bacterium]